MLRKEKNISTGGKRKRKEETTGRAIEEGSPSQDRHAIDAACTVCPMTGKTLLYGWIKTSCLAVAEITEGKHSGGTEGRSNFISCEDVLTVYNV